MILYNVTVNVDYDAADEWLNWMIEEHIPDVLATGLFGEAKIMRILAEEEGGKSYSVQYFCNSMEDFEKYEKEHAPALREAYNARYAGKAVAFRTLLDVVHHNDGKS